MRDGADAQSRMDGAMLTPVRWVACGVLKGENENMDSNLFKSLEWRNIGPHRGGRVVAVAGHPAEPGTFFFGGCAGGVWKTTSGGALWENVSDGYFTTAAIGAIAVSASSPSVVYAGTG